MSTGDEAGNETATTTHYPTPAERTLEAFRLYEAELAPGAVEILARSSVQSVGYLSPEARAEKVAELIAGPLGARWRNVEYKTPTLENGAEVSPLRLALTRYGDRLQAGAVEALHEKLAPLAAGKGPARVAGIVAKFVESEEGGRFHASHYNPYPVRATASAAKSEPTRQADGRFATPPATKPERHRSGF